MEPEYVGQERHQPLWSFETIGQSDIEALVEIEKTSFRHPWGAVSFREELACEYARNFALRNGGIIGYICFRLLFGEMHIFRIAVRHEWRHHGIASLILDKSLKLASEQGAEIAFLEVRPSNVSALALYRKFGFAVIGKRPGYYAETGEDALILTKQLKTVCLSSEL